MNILPILLSLCLLTASCKTISETRLKDGGENTAVLCKNGLDDDGDDYTDCRDSDCAPYVFCAEGEFSDLATCEFAETGASEDWSEKTPADQSEDPADAWVDFDLDQRLQLSTAYVSLEPGQIVTFELDDPDEVPEGSLVLFETSAMPILELDPEAGTLTTMVPVVAGEVRVALLYDETILSNAIELVVDPTPLTEAEALAAMSTLGAGLTAMTASLVEPDSSATMLADSDEEGRQAVAAYLAKLDSLTAELNRVFAEEVSAEDRLILATLFLNSGLTELLGPASAYFLTDSDSSAAPPRGFWTMGKCVSADLISAVLSAVKAVSSVIKIACLISGVGAPAGALLHAFELVIGLFDAFIDGFLPTDVMEGTIELTLPYPVALGQEAPFILRADFGPQSDPFEVTIGVAIDGLFEFIELETGRSTAPKPKLKYKDGTIKLIGLSQAQVDQVKSFLTSMLTKATGWTIVQSPLSDLGARLKTRLSRKGVPIDLDFYQQYQRALVTIFPGIDLVSLLDTLERYTSLNLVAHSYFEPENASFRKAGDDEFYLEGLATGRTDWHIELLTFAPFDLPWGLNLFTFGLEKPTVVASVETLEVVAAYMPTGPALANLSLLGAVFTVDGTVEATLYPETVSHELVPLTKEDVRGRVVAINDTPYKGFTAVTIENVGNKVPAAGQSIVAAMLIDDSGSMGDAAHAGNDPTEQRYEAAKAFVEAFEGDFRLGFWQLNAGLIVDLTSDSAALYSAIDANHLATGGTPLYGAAKEVVTALAAAKATVKTILILTDGLADDGELYDEVVAAAKAAEVTIYAVGLGTEVDAQFQGLAAHTGGAYTLIEDPLGLTTLFTTIGKATSAGSVVVEFAAEFSGHDLGEGDSVDFELTVRERSLAVRVQR